MVSDFDDGNHRSVKNALLSLSKRDRLIFMARYLRGQQIDSIARDHKISYWRTCHILRDTLKKVREIVGNIIKSPIDINGGGASQSTLIRNRRVVAADQKAAF